MNLSRSNNLFSQFKHQCLILTLSIQTRITSQLLKQQIISQMAYSFIKGSLKRQKSTDLLAWNAQASFNRVCKQIGFKQIPQKIKNQSCQIHRSKFSKLCRKCNLQQKDKVDDKKCKFDQQIIHKIVDINNLPFKYQANAPNYNLFGKLVISINAMRKQKKQLKCIINELDKFCQYAHPWQKQDQPSLFIRLLYQLLEYHPTRQQLYKMQQNDNLFIKLASCLLIRLVGDPKQYWAWLNRFLYNEQQIRKNRLQKLQFRLLIKNLLIDNTYFQIKLLKPPFKYQKELQKRVQQAELKIKRFKQNKKQRELIIPGAKIRVLVDNIFKKGQIIQVMENQKIVYKCEDNQIGICDFMSFQLPSFEQWLQQQIQVNKKKFRQRSRDKYG